MPLYPLPLVLMAVVAFVGGPVAVHNQPATLGAGLPLQVEISLGSGASAADLIRKCGHLPGVEAASTGVAAPEGGTDIVINLSWSVGPVEKACLLACLHSDPAVRAVIVPV